MRSDRLLSALLLLQAHGRLTGRELAERLEVSARTVHRDMEALSASGVPVLALRGAQGGWQLDENWRTQVPGLKESELRALLMAQPRVIGDSRLAAAAERALEKLMAALPTSLRHQAASIRQRLYVDPTGWRGPAEDLAALPIVQDALSLDRKLTFLYHQTASSTPSASSPKATPGISSPTHPEATAPTPSRASNNPACSISPATAPPSSIWPPPGRPPPTATKPSVPSTTPPSASNPALQNGCPSGAPPQPSITNTIQTGRPSASSSSMSTKPPSSPSASASGPTSSNPQPSANASKPTSKP
jgi:biotin operon repressor